ncbi:MAG: hypothetical protein J2P13_02215 [Acidobacteria bacterium]|nr:hypothetical protein [Acidobacteriota bacterium]
MGKISSVLPLSAIITGCALLASCGGGSPTTVTNEILPTGISISPSPMVSLEVGKTQTFTASPTGHTYSFQSDNPSVVTVAANGDACAGTWNSLTSPQICTPGQPGMATVTASTQGVVTAGVTVYVHAPITSITISKVPGQTPTVSDSCLSRGAVHGPESWLFQANAFNGTADITSSVGPFSWQQINPGSSNIVNLGTPGNGTEGCLLSPGGQCLNLQTATANTPGVSQIYATVGGFNSHPIPIETCHIQSISLAAEGNPPSTTSFLVTSGASTTLNASVVDAAKQTITGVPITWSASNPISANHGTANNTGTVYGSTNTVTVSTEGAGTILASCTPPSCNGGITPSFPIYPQAAFSFNVQPATTTTAASPSVFATTTACTDPIRNPLTATCTPAVVPITRASTTAMFTAGAPVSLATTPNSFVYDNAGGTAYLGVETSNFSQQGLMVFSGSTPTNATNLSGKVLAVSPDQSSVILSNTADKPNQLFICSSCNVTGRVVAPFLISGATSAAFSPDSLKAYILAGNNAYVYSKVDPLEPLPPISGAGNDVVFHPQGNFAYVAGPTGLTTYRSCDNSLVDGGNVPTPNPALMVRALGDGSTLVVLDPPDITIISTSFPPQPTGLPSPDVCTGTINNPSSPPSFGLGQGSFIPSQFIVAPDDSRAYILGETSSGPPPARLPFIIAFNFATRTPSVISLSNSAVPLNAAISPDSSLLFVGADDGTVHVIDAVTGADTQQVTFTFPANALCVGPGSPPTQVPLSEIQVLAAAENGSTTTYSYRPVSGPVLKAGQSITISQMANGGNNGTFTIAALGIDPAGNATFTVTNSNGVSATGQSGLGVVPVACNPDMVAVKP